MVAHTNQQQFKRDVLEASLPVVVDFYASWCPPCRMLTPIFHELAQEFGDRVRFVKVNTDDEAGLASQYRIQGVPAPYFFDRGRIVEHMCGLPDSNVLRQKIAELAARNSTASHVE